jgi:hypothetical protein
MPEHSTFFGKFTNLTERLYWDLQTLYALERRDGLTDEQKSALVKYRMDVRSSIHSFRELLKSIEREHGLESVEDISRDTVDSLDCDRIADALELFATHGVTADGRDGLTPEGKQHTLVLRDLFLRLAEVSPEHREIDNLVYVYRISKIGGDATS